MTKPIIRIFLRYVVGAAILGSQAMGDDLAADPDLVLAISLLIGAATEYFYMKAKKNGGAT